MVQACVDLYLVQTFLHFEFMITVMPFNYGNTALPCIFASYILFLMSEWLFQPVKLLNFYWLILVAPYCISFSCTSLSYQLVYSFDIDNSLCFYAHYLSLIFNPYYLIPVEIRQLFSDITSFFFYGYCISICCFEGGKPRARNRACRMWFFISGIRFISLL
mgnify:CR=1 FL=1